MPAGRRLAAILLAVLAGAPAFAHTTNLSRSTVSLVERQVRYELAISSHDLAVAVGIETDLIAPVPRAALAAKADAIRRYLGARLRIAADGAPCAQGTIGLDWSRLPETVRANLAFDCPPGAQEIHLVYTVFFDIDEAHRAIGRIDLGTGAQEFLLEPGLNDLRVPLARPLPAPDPWLAAGRYVRLGIVHIAGGLDHVLFVLALLLVSARFWHLVSVVTAFTVAHAITLSLAWFGAIAPPLALVEVLIAASIAWVAGENIIRANPVRRWPLAFGFGLVHGLGFYAVLRQIAPPAGAPVLPLVAFNLGIEAGQVAILAVFHPLQRQVFARAWYRPAARVASAAILALALFWMVQRAFSV